jgi:hypothetical protein
VKTWPKMIKAHSENVKLPTHTRKVILNIGASKNKLWLCPLLPFALVFRIMRMDFGTLASFAYKIAFERGNNSSKFTSFVQFKLMKSVVYRLPSQVMWITAQQQCKAGVTFDNSFFDNYFDLVQQLKNRLFLGPVFVHVTGWTKN